MSEIQQSRAGLQCSRSATVTSDLTVPALSPQFAGLLELPPVLATGQLTAFMEWTCHEAVRPYLTPNERTVGISVALKHTAATPVGMKIFADVELLAVNGKILQFAFSCRDEAGPIAEGLHDRAIIDYDRFMAKVARKTAS